MIYGKSGTARGRLDLANLGATNGFAVLGNPTGDGVGDAVVSAGDVNGDGLDDVIIGAPSADLGGTNAGSAHVVYGQPGTARS